MKIEMIPNGSALTVNLEGALDTNTAPDLEAQLFPTLDNVKDLTIDFEKLGYISSAGLRVLLKAQKQMNVQGSMKLLHVSEAIMEVFDITGFVDILTIE